MHHFDILGAIGGLNSLTTPAYLSMMLHIACKLGISCIKVSTNEACPAKALACCTLEDVGLPIFDILNSRDSLEKDVYRGVPVLLKLV
jgi:hypothetical protein